ncbi:MAG: flavodoxin, partial [Deltaproteobacteria bacterium]|nr:flavodoxin [Deltaproteobacteria bacterium]
ALTESLYEMVKKKQNLNDTQWADKVKQMTGHPNKEDADKAKAFAKELLA